MGVVVSQENILIGIDLGTTNSSVAINIGGSIEIVKKPGGNEYTPSVFGFDKAKNKVVGQKAYEALYSESSDDGVKNFKPEVKRIIGTPAKFFFERPTRRPCGVSCGICQRASVRGPDRCRKRPKK